MKITFSKINTIKKEIEVKADNYKSVYFDIESARTDGAKIDPKVFTSLAEIKIGSLNASPDFTDIQVSAFATLVKNGYSEISIEDLYEYLVSKTDNTKDTPYKIKISSSSTGNIIAGVSKIADAVEGTIQYALTRDDIANKYVDLLISDSFNTIGVYAFRDCRNLTSVIIPDSVTSIDNGVFSDCTSLTSVMIPDSVTSIGSMAFYKCDSLTLVTIPDSVTCIGSYAFYYCTNLTSVIIPDSVTSIDNGVFSDCTSLTSVTIPDSVTSIGSYAFYNCTSLASVTIPDSVTSISKSTFQCCRSLKSVTIPDSVTSIGDYAFWCCESLTTINYTGTKEQWNAITFGNNWNSKVPSDCVINYNYQG